MILVTIPFHQMMTKHKQEEDLQVRLKKLQKDHDSLKKSFKKAVNNFRLTEIKLKESEEKYKLLFQTKRLIESLPDIVWSFSDKRGTLYVSPRVESILGYSPAYLCRNPWLWNNSIHPEDKNNVARAVAEFPTSRQVDVRYRIRDSSGEWHWFHDRSTGINEECNETIMEGISRDITDYVHTEEKIKDIQNRMNFFFGQSLEGIYFTELEEPILWNDSMNKEELLDYAHQHQVVTNVNNAFLEHYGLSREDIIGKPVTILFKHDRQQGRSGRRELFDKGHILRTTNEKHKNGSDILIEGEYLCIYDEEGRITGTCGVQRDITDRKRAEDALRASETLYRTLVQTSPYAITMTDLQGKITFASQRTLELHGYVCMEDMVGRTALNLIAPEDHQRAMDNLKKTLMEGSIHQIEYIFVRRDGSRFPALLSASLLLGTDGNPAAFISTTTDITESKRAEEALRLEKENFRRSLDDSPLGIRIATLEGDTIYANDALLELYGYDRLQELQNTPLNDRYTPESYSQALKRKQSRKRGDLRETDYEVSIVRKDGQVRNLHVLRKEILWDGVRHFQVIYNDITEHKQVEKELRRSRESLEDLNRRLNEVREEERASISREIHDQLGQSLTALKIDLNRMKKNHETNSKIVAELDEMIDLASNIIKDVQRISSELHPEILFDLGLVPAIEWYSERFEARTGIRCDLRADESEYNDPRKNLILFRILQEALTNVIRHANATAVSITLRQTKDGIILSLRDNGTGISVEKAESPESMGIVGMRERARQLGGKIKISSIKNKGTVLSVNLPA